MLFQTAIYDNKCQEKFNNRHLLPFAISLLIIITNSYNWR